ncbi:hypothetical protein K2173_015982 [Erythroxylum novogranatense]|uniref:Uncharacterized protein n=1 Tax=Erythroxylum novogranatense TaxID=1862640 RepID=A0AAV8SEY0_9ROSI|nr:hypothetical protein K2173_015982 [Erythroxylum novogranatense]
MATSSKFDLSSASPDRPVYASGQRGSHLASQFDRSGSFRDSMENPILSSLPNLTRGSCIVGQADVVNFFQCIRFDPKVVAAEHKSSRQGDFRRHLNVALGISGDDSPIVSSKGKMLPEDIKRVKAILRESNVKARERMKIFNEALSVFNKCFPNVSSKKKSIDRSGALLSSDRSVLGPSVAKMGIQNLAVNSGSEIEPQKSEERTKHAVPNKRTRTSLVDVRGNALIRPSAALDRDREMLRLANSGTVQGDERTLSIGVDGWEKAKLKKKRSVIKSDVPPSVMSIKSTDGYREPKQGMQQRPGSDNRARLNSDSHGFRPGVANGAVGVGKSDSISQSSGINVRSSLPRNDLDNNSHLGERRERPVGTDKERSSFRAANKSNVRDDFNSASPMSTTKMSASIRAPRSSSGITAKSQVVNRASTSNGLELSNCTNKPLAVGPNSRKRSASARSSSPPVAQWAGQRPQKISRIARRTNLIPIISNNDESPALDNVSDVSGNELGSGFARRLTGDSPQQVKSKVDLLSSAALSESEESGTPEIKSIDKGKKSEEVDDKAGQNIQKVLNLSLPSRKNKLVSGDDLTDGPRREGRSGRGLISARSVMPIGVERLGNVGTAKQLRHARVGFDKNENKTGRPPSRKLSDRKAYARKKQTTSNTPADFLVGSDDGQEELLAAASAVINPAHSCLNSFWRQMERFFGFISNEDIAKLNQQDTQVECAETNYELEEQFLQRGADIPLCQRLLAAIIPGDDSTHTNGDLELDGHGAGFELDGQLGPDGINHSENFHLSGHLAFNGFKVTGNGESDEADMNFTGISSIDVTSNFSHSANGVLQDPASISIMTCPELQYDNMQTNEKLLLELQSIGIFPHPVVDLKMEDEGIFKDISKLEEKYRGQVSKKKALQNKLLKFASETKVLQEKEFEQRAYDKLISMAYEKYMTCRRSHTAGGKGSSNKIAKQAALAFVKRTLDYCHRFEDTGNSCFSEQLFKDMFHSGPSHLTGAQSADAHSDGESAKLYVNSSSHSLEARVSASMGSQPSPLNSRLGLNGESYNTNSINMLHPVNQLAEQTSGKEDPWLSRGKKRELLLDDVGNAGPSSVPSGIGGSLPSSTKGKRSERDRDGKGHNKEVLSRNGTNKIGRPASSNAKGERKLKTKPKQKTTQLSVSVNGLVGKITEQPKPTLASESKSREVPKDGSAKGKDGFKMDALDHEAVDLSSLPDIDELDGEEQDLGSWLNIDDDGLHDHGDFMGLEIPMDDLSDLTMMV